MADIRPFREQHPRIAASAYLDPRCTVIGDVHIGERSSIWPGVVIRGDVNRIRVGAESNIQDNSVLHNSHDSAYLPGGTPLIVGDQVTVGHSVVLHGCTIGDLCLIGMGAVILDRAVIEPESCSAPRRWYPAARCSRAAISTPAHRRAVCVR